MSNYYVFPGDLAEFKESYTGLENILLCCKDTYDPRTAGQISKMKKKVEELETVVFWAEAKNLFFADQYLWGDMGVLIKHRGKFECKCLECLNYSYLWVRPPNRLEIRELVQANKPCTWKDFIENAMNDLGLTFERLQFGNTNETRIFGGFKIEVTSIDYDFCSGIQGNWRMGASFGSNLLNDSTKREKILKLISILSN